MYRNISAVRYSCLILYCLPALSSYDSHAGPMASNAEVSGQLDVLLTTAKCYPEAVCPVVIVYIGTGGKVLLSKSRKLPDGHQECFISLLSDSYHLKLCQ